MNGSPYHTTAELARLFRKSVATVSGWCSSGKIRGAFKTPGGEWLIPKDFPSISPESPFLKTCPDFSGLSSSEIVRKLHDGNVTFHPRERVMNDTCENQDNREEVLVHEEEK